MATRTYKIVLVRGRGPFEEDKEFRYTTTCTIKEQADDMAQMYASARCADLRWDDAEIYLEEIPSGE